MKKNVQATAPAAAATGAQGLSRRTILWVLFRSMFMLSACTFGGGWVIVSLLKKKFVEELKWFGEDEMLDITAITQSAPGPLPVNASVIIGYRMDGIVGALVAVLGTVIPPTVIISVICVFYNEFRSNRYIAIALQVMSAGVAAVIIDVSINLVKTIVGTRRALYILMMLVAFTCRYVLGISAVLIIFSCLFIGLGDLLLSLKNKTSIRKAQVPADIE